VAYVWWNAVLGAIFVLAIVGIPMWLVLKDPDGRPAASTAERKPATYPRVVWSDRPVRDPDEAYDRVLVGAFGASRDDG
jgi:hypothetical protein